MNKYRNKKTEYDGILFDSRHEAQRYAELKLLQRAGEIRNLQTQVPFTLTPEIRDESGKVIERESKYIADFVYLDNATGKTVVEDAKGIRTDVYKLKKKLMLLKYEIRIKEV